MEDLYLEDTLKDPRRQRLGPRPGVSFRSIHFTEKRFRSGLVFKAHRLLYHSTLGLRVIKKRRRRARYQTAERLIDAGTRFVPGYSLCRHSL